MTCACGRPLHYASPAIRALVEQLIRQTSPTLQVTIPELGRAWLVPRHYIALHGLRGRDLPALAARYGFEEVPP